MDVAQVLIDGKWRAADAEGTFHAENPAKGEPLPLAFPISRWSDCDAALTAATKAAAELRTIEPARIAAFLDTYAANIEAAADSIVAAAAEETALPVTPRLKDVELPRTTNQLRQAAAAVREESWRHATLDLEKNIRSCFSPIGPVVIFGPNNFPFAFNGVSGGDFAAAIAAGNPVIAKAHPLHPNTTRLLAEQALKAVASAGLSPATVQLIYNISNENGLKLVSDPRVGAVGFTGSRNAGLYLKRAAEDAGKPIYLEMSSINPVIFLPGALAERPEQLGQELVDSVLAGSGQFCTSPNLVLAFDTPQTEPFLNQIAKSLSERPAQPLLSAAGRKQLHQGVTALTSAGAKLVTGGDNAPGDGYRYANTLLRATATQFLAAPRDLQREIFGNATLAVTVNTQQELESILRLLEGNLTGTIYSAKSGADDKTYDTIAPLLREKVGRLLNDKMPTGVAVSPAMNHGGPYPSTSHPGSTSVGIPTSITRFAKLDCYDAVRPERLPAILKDTIANPNTWRSINGSWVKG
ncbi:MAG TPA: aldehyde dehydrogenase (NADP(+)) [Edaphobacter sp.]|jgi:alpha-ketoglutaric semialdehyde dehydrogenase|nr:aldehyde dehydrogenase (NADP(+)) [Edaphobacter sp.]